MLVKDAKTKQPYQTVDHSVSRPAYWPSAVAWRHDDGPMDESRPAERAAKWAIHRLAFFLSYINDSSTSYSNPTEISTDISTDIST
jgi:hypothetical protein